jgi:hypothetical protein
MGFRFLPFYFLLFLYLLHSKALQAQINPDTSKIRRILEVAYDRDQNLRKSRDSIAFAHQIDSANQFHVKKILDENGWMDRSLIGKKASHGLFLVIQHADLQTQIKYFPLLKASVEKGESQASHMALMEDRIRIRQGKNQLYGSQVTTDPTTGKQVFYPIEDESNVDDRRRKLGMMPLSDYAELFGMMYPDTVSTKVTPVSDVKKKKE